jgi:hypothetical protein
MAAFGVMLCTLGIVGVGELENHWRSIVRGEEHALYSVALMISGILIILLLLINATLEERKAE